MAPTDPHTAPCKELVELSGKVVAHEKELDGLTGWVQRIDDAREKSSIETARELADLRASMRMAAFLGSLVGGGMASIVVGVIVYAVTHGGPK